MKLREISEDTLEARLDRALDKIIQEGVAATAGHVALDVAGFVPFFGEAADISNALWYIGEGEYLQAALSLVSCIPDLGDVVAKTVKYLGLAKFFGKFGPKIAKLWTTKVVPICQKSEKLRPAAKKMDAAIKLAVEQYKAHKPGVEPTPQPEVQQMA